MSIPHNPNRRQFTTPPGYAKFPHLNTPDTKFVEDGVYKVDVAYDANSDEAKELVAIIDGYLDDAMAEQKEEMKAAAYNKAVRYTPYVEEEDEEGEPTGRLIFRFKANAKIKDRRSGKQVERTIPIFDAKGGKPLQQPPVIRMGSTIKVSAQVGKPWYNPTAKQIGVSLYISAVQVLELAEAASGAGGFGFGDETAAYEAVGETEAEKAGFESEDSGSADESDSEDEGDF